MCFLCTAASRWIQSVKFAAQMAFLMETELHKGTDVEGRRDERIYEEECFQSHSVIFCSTGGFQKPSVLHWPQMGALMAGSYQSLPRWAPDQAWLGLRLRKAAATCACSPTPQLPTAWKPKAQLLLMWGCSRVPPGPGICDRGNAWCSHSIYGWKTDGIIRVLKQAWQCSCQLLLRVKILWFSNMFRMLKLPAWVSACLR